MRDLRSCSGPWRGTWDQGQTRGAMALTLRFSGDRIAGEGTDRSGPFTMAGEVDADGAAVYLVKAYPRFSVRYDGRWNGSFIAGRSGLVPPAWGLAGTFELWPEDEETALDREATRGLATV